MLTTHVLWKFGEDVENFNEICIKTIYNVRFSDKLPEIGNFLAIVRAFTWDDWD